MAKALEAAGFRVTLRSDVTEKGMKEAVRTFKGQIAGGDQAIFYFSGHGVQLGAANYLLPVDIKGESEEQVKDDALPLQRVLDDLQDQKAGFSLAIIDACRNNPFKGSGQRGIGGRGLAPTSAASGQMVLFSAGAGQTALDKLGEDDHSSNGLFTRVLLVEMQKPGVPVDRMLHNVRDEVVRLARSVGHEQVPALYDQALGEFYFSLPSSAATANSSSNLANPVVVIDGDSALWAEVQKGNTVDDYGAYLSQFPNGRYQVLANARLKRMNDEASAECDRLAGDPDDPGRNGEGVQYNWLQKGDTKSAVKACKSAPPTARNLYQLGRAIAVENVEERILEAVLYWRKSASLGYGQAEAYLCFYLKEARESVDWCRKAVAQGNPWGQFVMASLYLNGSGVPKDINIGIELLKKAASQGLAAAQGDLGFHYEKGDILPRDYGQALKWYELAAARTDNAQTVKPLCNAYAKGIGVAADWKKAVECEQHGIQLAPPQDKDEIDLYRASIGEAYLFGGPNLPANIEMARFYLKDTIMEMQLSMPRSELEKWVKEPMW